jgi:hypothetical protein
MTAVQNKSEPVGRFIRRERHADAILVASSQITMPIGNHLGGSPLALVA